MSTVSSSPSSQHHDVYNNMIWFKVGFSQEMSSSLLYISRILHQYNITPTLKETVRVMKNYPQQQEEQGVLQQIIRPPQRSDLKLMESLWEKNEEKEPKSRELAWNNLLSNLEKLYTLT